MKCSFLPAFVVIGFICGSLAADDKDDAAKQKEALTKQLQADYETLLGKEADPQSVKKAAELLESTDRSSHWTNFFEATKILRTTRAKAGVPLLMIYMLKHADYACRNTEEYARTITMLTGHDTPQPPGRDNAANTQIVKDLVEKWWAPNRDKISTDLSEMTGDQLANVLDRLVGVAAREFRTSGGAGDSQSAYGVYHLVYDRVLHRSSSDERTSGVHKEDLCAQMVPLMLQRVGWRKDAPRIATSAPATRPASSPAVVSAPPKSTSMLFEIIPMLAELRKDRQAEDLDKIATDESQPTSCRLTCMLALCMAGEKLPTEPLLAVIKSEPRLSLRLIAIICLPSSTDADGAFKAAMAALEDENAEVRAAGAWAIGGLPRPEAVPALKKMLEKNDSRQTSLPAIIALGKIKTGKSADALAKFLESALKGDNKAGDIYQALSAFESVTGRRTIPPGANKPEVYKELATEAIKWWITQEGILPGEKPCPANKE